MSKNKPAASRRLIAALLAALALMVSSLPSASAAPRAAEAAAVRYVAPLGIDAANDCTLAAAPCQTVQRAVEAAQAGDEIRVAAGTYTGSMSEGGMNAVVILSKDIAALRGGYATDFSLRNTEVFVTILTAGGAPGKQVLVLWNVDTVVEGFTLTGGSANCSPSCGGGVRIRGGSPNLTNNHITLNFGQDRAGGIYVDDGANPAIVSNVIDGNTTSGNGAGIFVQGSNARITGNQILSNIADVEGGGIFVDSNVPALINFNAIGLNRAVNACCGGGGGIRTIGGPAVVTIAHNDVFSNTVFGGGGGIYAGSPAIVDSNTVHHNTLQIGGWGGAILVGAVTLPVSVINNVVYANHGSAVQAVNAYQVALVNNTIVDTVHVQSDSGTEADGYLIWNDPNYGGPINLLVQNNIVANNQNCGLFYHDAGTVTTLNNLLWNNAGDAANYCEGASAGPGDLHTPPLFISAAAADYRLRSDSPARDVGRADQAPNHDADDF
ncbi:MAG TPA: right-handed parallel beta-helix repeat-containing protein, partial [Chloroflexia bacterium]|nr:right-handed parallel beta-helix repeat-containing protein [Chloroflexia bacterium]